MPRSPQRACVFGCANDAATCPEHSRTARTRQWDASRGTRQQRGYGTRWESYRDWHEAECFRKQVPRAGLCGARLPGTPETTDSECARLKRVERGTVLDHIQPVSGADDPMFFNPAGQQWLCAQCHNRKRQRESTDTVRANVG